MTLDSRASYAGPQELRVRVRLADRSSAQRHGCRACRKDQPAGNRACPNHRRLESERKHQLLHAARRQAVARHGGKDRETGLEFRQRTRLERFFLPSAGLRGLPARLAGRFSRPRGTRHVLAARSQSEMARRANRIGQRAGPLLAGRSPDGGKRPIRRSCPRAPSKSTCQAGATGLLSPFGTKDPPAGFLPVRLGGYANGRNFMENASASRRPRFRPPIRRSLSKTSPFSFRE